MNLKSHLLMSMSCALTLCELFFSLSVPQTTTRALCISGTVADGTQSRGSYHEWLGRGRGSHQRNGASIDQQWFDIILMAPTGRFRRVCAVPNQMIRKALKAQFSIG